MTALAACRLGTLSGDRRDPARGHREDGEGGRARPGSVHDRPHRAGEPALVEKLLVEYYGSPVPLQQLAGFQVPEARQLIVKPHDRTTLGADRDGDPRERPRHQPDERRRRHPAQRPALTEQRRKDYVKIVKNMAEDGRIAVRNVRRDARKHLEAAEKAGEISIDQLERAEKELEKITHEHVELIDKAFGRKEQELLEV
jgi:ribosome recycling factor